MPTTPTIPHLILTELADRVTAATAIPGSPWTSVRIKERKAGTTEAYGHGDGEIELSSPPTPIDGTQLQWGYTRWTMEATVSVAIAQPAQPENPESPQEWETAAFIWVALHAINTIIQAVRPSQTFGTLDVPQLAELVAVVGTAQGKSDDETETGVSVTFRFTFSTRTDNLAIGL